MSGELEVWGHHRLLDRFGAGASTRVEPGGELVVCDVAGNELSRYRPGDWSVVGHDVAHAALEDDPDCPICHPSPPEPT